MGRFWREYLLAVQFFTRIPVTGRLAQWVGYSPALVAMVTAALLAALPRSGYVPLVAVVWSTAFGVLITGAFHGPERERALIIMKDSRVGAFGAIAMVLVLVLLIRLMPHVGDAADSKSKPLADQISGDCLGATQQLCELAFYFGVTVSL